MSLWTRGVVASGCLLLIGCGPVEVDAPDLDRSDGAACAEFLDDLPATLNGQGTVEFEPSDAPAAAYGDPAIVVVCGVDLPRGFGEAAHCERAGGVDWYAPPEQYEDQEVDVTLTSVSHRPAVRLLVPDDYRPDGVAAALSQIADAVESNLEKVDECL